MEISNQPINCVGQDPEVKAVMLIKSRIELAIELPYEGTVHLIDCFPDPKVPQERRPLLFLFVILCLSSSASLERTLQILSSFSSRLKRTIWAQYTVFSMLYPADLFLLHWPIWTTLKPVKIIPDSGWERVKTTAMQLTFWSLLGALYASPGSKQIRTWREDPHQRQGQLEYVLSRVKTSSKGMTEVSLAWRMPIDFVKTIPERKQISLNLKSLHPSQPH